MRIIVGVIAIPMFRLILKKVVRLQDLDAELEKDLEQWFRGSLLLLAATANMEDALFGWVPLDLKGDDLWVGMGFRLLLAVSVIEAMPDQELFAVIHPGPPKLQFSKDVGYWAGVKAQFWPFMKGVLCQHINRSSPVFAILAAIATGRVGWICYCIASFQYLIIGLVTSRDKALDVLSEFDKQVAIRRRELIEEFEIEGEPAEDRAANKERAPACPEAAASAPDQAADNMSTANPSTESPPTDSATAPSQIGTTRP